jgi:hypothetical protein
MKQKGAAMGMRIVVLSSWCAVVSLSCGGGTAEPPASAAGPAVGTPEPSEPSGATSERPPTAVRGDAAATPPAEWTACTTDGECVAIEIACCDHCNGGALLSINRAHEAQAVERYRARDCGETMCTQMACFGPDAVCREGACTLERSDRPMP